MPQMGESIFEGTITKWLKKPGDTVQRDEPLFEISTDKVDAEIPSPASGTLSEIKVDAGNTVQINTVVAVIGEGDGAVASKPAPAAPAPAKQEAPKEAQKPEPPKAAPAPAAPVEAAASSGGGTNVVMPQMGESIFEGTITKWLKKVGDSVQRDEPLFEISTDKVDAEIPSPAGGTLSEIKVEAGNTVQINTVVAVIGGGAAKTSAPAATAHRLPRKRQPRQQPRPPQQHNPPRQRRTESACVRRPWCARLRRSIRSICARSPARARPAALRRTTSCNMSRRAALPRLQQPLPRQRNRPAAAQNLLLRQQPAHNRASWCRSHACAPSSRSA